VTKCKSDVTLLEIYQRKLLEKIDGIGFLYPDFAELIYDLSRTIRQHQMPFQIYETYRTPARQKKMIDLGLSKLRDPMDSMHVHGVAVDVLLDSRAVRSLKKNRLAKITDSDVNQKKSNISSDYGGVYNLGVNAIELGNNKPRTVIEDKVVYDFWNYLGLLIERQFPDLVWGGKSNLKSGSLIGTDPPHIEYRYARDLIAQRRTINVLKGQGNPGLDKVSL